MLLGSRPLAHGGALSKLLSTQPTHTNTHMHPHTAPTHTHTHDKCVLPPHDLGAQEENAKLAQASEDGSEAEEGSDGEEADEDDEEAEVGRAQRPAGLARC